MTDSRAFGGQTSLSGDSGGSLQVKWPLQRSPLHVAWTSFASLWKAVFSVTNARFMQKQWARLDLLFRSRRNLISPVVIMPPTAIGNHMHKRLSRSSIYIMPRRNLFFSSVISINFSFGSKRLMTFKELCRMPWDVSPKCILHLRDFSSPLSRSTCSLCDAVLIPHSLSQSIPHISNGFVRFMDEWGRRGTTMWVSVVTEFVVDPKRRKSWKIVHRCD